jgi:putative oxygen-independent coproporphyrinogen III oxidase
VNRPAGPSSPGAATTPVGLYVHVPFCVSICPYCDFVVYPGAQARGPAARIEAFAGAVSTELGLRADALDARFGPPDTVVRPPLRSVYFGGGTPSLLPSATIATLLALIRRRFGLASDAEVTLEANPGVSERGDLSSFVAAGIDRVSLGAQALDLPTLRRLGRRHAPADVGDSVGEARASGIRSIGLDLLYDVPDQTLDGWVATLDRALALEPDHLSLYALTLDDPDADGLTGPTGDHLPVRRGARRWRDRARSQQDDDRAARMYEVAAVRLAGAGFRGYEISNWARPGHESRHNLAYWRRQPVEAVGPGAHAFDGAVRRWNAARLEPYLAALVPAGGDLPSLPPGGSTSVSDAEATAEHVILELRLDDGIPAAVGERQRFAAAFRWARGVGLVRDAGDRIVLTTRGRLLSNELFVRLI